MRQPNIVWLLTDHHIYRHHRDLYGKPEMPTYDRLCREGLHFSRAQSVCPLCTPARASMLTGQYPYRHGMTMNTGQGSPRTDFDSDARLFAHYLRQAGYRVGYFGKWHTGNERTALDYEFDGWTLPGYGCPYVSGEYRRYCSELGIPEARINLEWSSGGGNLPREEFSVWGEENPWKYMGSAGVLTTAVESHEAYFVTHLADRWIEEVAASGAPFCARVDVWGPHFPYWVGGDFAGSVDPESIAEYPNYDHTLSDRPENHRWYKKMWREKGLAHRWPEWQKVIARAYEHAHLVDDALGRVVDTIDKLGIADDTIILYTADHGDLLASQGGLFDKGSMMVEETMGIPFAIRWPGKVKPDGVTGALVTNMDLVPTVLEAGGADIPSDTDGRSVLSLAQAPESTDWPDDLMCTSHGHGHPHFQRLLRWGDYKYTARPDDIDEFYDLGADPYETSNRADDPEFAALVSEARRRLAAWMEKHDDNEPESLKIRRRIG
jgi:arylsulfatase A-like enzyme